MFFQNLFFWGHCFFFLLCMCYIFVLKHQHCRVNAYNVYYLFVLFVKGLIGDYHVCARIKWCLA